MSLGTGGWHPVALSSGLAPGTANGTRILGREIVVWRDSAGIARAFDDRCPHRGMRLSFGFVRGNEIACLYHGWRYDAAGRCRHIPAHPDLLPPETIRATVHETTERLGMTWVRTEPAPAAALPEERTVTEVRSIAVERSADEVIAHALRDAGPSVSALTPSLLLFWTGEEHILAGVQAVSAGAAMLHVVGVGERGEAGRKRINTWAERLRNAIEAGARA
jgi:nitrite reductase/ring-hydroxylating ferredoxin subunit